MQISGPDHSTTPGDIGGARNVPRDPEAAARRFEEVLIKQMVQTMTRDMFDSGLAGEEGPQWTGTYGEMQSDVLATELAKRLSESGKLGIAELLLKQWQHREEIDSPPEESPSFIHPSTPETVSIHPYTEA